MVTTIPSGIVATWMCHHFGKNKAEVNGPPTLRSMPSARRDQGPGSAGLEAAPEEGAGPGEAAEQKSSKVGAAAGEQPLDAEERQ